MGLSPFRKSCYVSPAPIVQRVLEWVTRTPPAPDPSYFHIVEVHEVGDFCVVDVSYPNCKNYEGRKILVMEGTAESIKKLKKLDPHFQPGEQSPIARFEPTARGRNLAYETARRLNKF